MLFQLFTKSTETLSSLSRTNTSSSTAPLVPAKPQSSHLKDYERGFGNLQTTYGFGGGAPTPTFAAQSSKPKNSSCSKPRSAKQLQRSDGSPQAKDWEAAYGALSASYGFGGGAPAMPGQASWLQSKK